MTNCQAAVRDDVIYICGDASITSEDEKGLKRNEQVSNRRKGEGSLGTL